MYHWISLVICNPTMAVIPKIHLVKFIPKAHTLNHSFFKAKVSILGWIIWHEATVRSSIANCHWPQALMVALTLAACRQLSEGCVEISPHENPIKWPYGLIDLKTTSPVRDVRKIVAAMLLPFRWLHVVSYSSPAWQQANHLHEANGEFRSSNSYPNMGRILKVIGFCSQQQHSPANQEERHEIPKNLVPRIISLLLVTKVLKDCQWLLPLAPLFTCSDTCIEYSHLSEAAAFKLFFFLNLETDKKTTKFDSLAKPFHFSKQGQKPKLKNATVQQVAVFAQIKAHFVP